MATAPVREVGYASAGFGWWSGVEDEPTPELRWPLSVPVFDAMRRQDAQAASVLRAVALPVRRTGWFVDPNGASDEVAQLVSDDLSLPIRGQDPKPQLRTKDRFSWPEHLRLALLMLVFGHSVFEQTYRLDGGRARLRKLGWRPPRTIERFNVAPDGGLLSVQQYATAAASGAVATRPIPVSQLVVYVHDREGGGWYGNSLLRPAYKHWLLKDRLIRVQAQTIERNGMGIPVYEGADGETDLAAGLAMAKGYRSGNSSAAATPFSAKLRLAGVEGTLPDADPAIRYHDEQIARAVLAHFLNLGTQTGSWALGTTFADFFTLSLQTLAQQVADTATQHIVEDLVDVNWGSEEPAPRIVFEEIGSRQAATAQALKLLADAGILLPDRSLEEAARQQFGLPPKSNFSKPATPPAPDMPAPGEPPASTPPADPQSA